MKARQYFILVKLGLIIFTPIVLLLLPADFFDEGPVMCLSRLILDIECYACGLTRGCMHFVHLNFEEAFDHNMMSFIVMPLLSVVWYQWFRKEVVSLMRTGFPVAKNLQWMLIKIKVLKVRSY